MLSPFSCIRRNFTATLALAALSCAMSPPVAFAAPTTFNFESVVNNATTFTASSQTWTTTGFMVGVVAAGFGSPTVGTASPTTNAYLDSGFQVSRSLGNIGGMKAPTGYTFRALKFDVWPSLDAGSAVYGGNNDQLGTVGLNYTVIGKRNGSQVVSANVTDTARTPPQSGSALGGYWHHLDLSATAFASTDIDTVEFVLVSQTGIAMNYIAVDNFVYDNFALAAVPTTVASLNRVNPATSNLSTVNWTLTFAAANTGVSASNFTLSGAAAAGATVGTPTTANSGLTWNVPVTTGSTAGTLTLSLVNATGTTPGVSSSLPFAGQSYTMDKVAPAVVSIVRQTPTSQATSSTSATFRVTFSEAVNAPTTANFAIAAVSSTITGTISSVTAVSGNPAAFDVAITITGGSGEFRLKVID
jgi:hypothetical protein